VVRGGYGKLKQFVREGTPRSETGLRYCFHLSRGQKAIFRFYRDGFPTMHRAPTSNLGEYEVWRMHRCSIQRARDIFRCVVRGGASWMRRRAVGIDPFRFVPTMKQHGLEPTTNRWKPLLKTTKQQAAGDAKGSVSICTVPRYRTFRSVSKSLASASVRVILTSFRRWPPGLLATGKRSGSWGCWGLGRGGRTDGSTRGKARHGKARQDETRQGTDEHTRGRFRTCLLSTEDGYASKRTTSPPEQTSSRVSGGWRLLGALPRAETACTGVGGGGGGGEVITAGVYLLCLAHVPKRRAVAVQGWQRGRVVRREVQRRALLRPADARRRPVRAVPPPRRHQALPGLVPVEQVGPDQWRPPGISHPRRPGHGDQECAGDRHFFQAGSGRGTGEGTGCRGWGLKGKTRGRFRERKIHFEREGEIWERKGERARK